MQVMNGEIQGVKDEIIVMKKDMDTLKSQTMNSIADLKVMDTLILDEVVRVHSILDKHKSDKKAHPA